MPHTCKYKCIFFCASLTFSIMAKAKRNHLFCNSTVRNLVHSAAAWSRETYDLARLCSQGKLYKRLSFEWNNQALNQVTWLSPIATYICDVLTVAATYHSPFPLICGMTSWECCKLHRKGKACVTKNNHTEWRNWRSLHPKSTARFHHCLRLFVNSPDI